MEATLKFDLCDPDDRTRHEQCVKAQDMAAAIFHITHNLKKHCEYHIDANPAMEPFDVLEYVFEQIHERIAESGIDPDRI